MDPPILHTSRLTLRRWRDADRAPFAAICADAEVMRHIGDGLPRPAAEAMRDIDGFEAEWDAAGHGLFALELRETGALAGFAGLSRPDFLPEILPSVEIGWRLARAHWGRGLATEAACAALDFGTRTRGLTDIVSIAQVGNAASLRIMEKIGLTFDRRTRHPARGVALDVYRLPR